MGIVQSEKNTKCESALLRNLHVSEKSKRKIEEVIKHCDMRPDAWALHVFIFLVAFFAFTSAIQLSSPIAEIEMPYFVKIMSQTLAMDLWQVTTFVSLLVFLCTLAFKSLSKVTLWAAGSLIGSSVWGAVQFFILLGQASFISASDGNPATSVQAFYMVPFYSFIWIVMMFVMAHMGLVAHRKTAGKYFLSSWHELPALVKLVLPLTLCIVALLQSNAAIAFLFGLL